MNLSKLRYLKKIAIKELEKSVYRVRVGAVIFNGHRIIGIGHNINRTHPMTRKYFCHGTLHAEIVAALSSTPEDLVGSSIFVYRMTKSGHPAFAMPCPQCAQILRDFRVKMAYWTTDTFPYWDGINIDYLCSKIDKTKAYLINKY